MAGPGAASQAPHSPGGRGGRPLRKGSTRRAAQGLGRAGAPAPSDLVHDDEPWCLTDLWWTFGIRDSAPRSPSAVPWAPSRFRSSERIAGCADLPRRNRASIPSSCRRYPLRSLASGSGSPGRALSLARSQDSPRRRARTTTRGGSPACEGLVGGRRGRDHGRRPTWRRWRGPQAHTDAAPLETVTERPAVARPLFAGAAPILTVGTQNITRSSSCGFSALLALTVGSRSSPDTKEPTWRSRPWSR